MEEVVLIDWEEPDPKPNPWAVVNAIFEAISLSGIRHSDSVDLIREDRDR